MNDFKLINMLIDDKLREEHSHNIDDTSIAKYFPYDSSKLITLANIEDCPYFNKGDIAGKIDGFEFNEVGDKILLTIYAKNNVVVAEVTNYDLRTNDYLSSVNVRSIENVHITKQSDNNYCLDVCYAEESSPMFNNYLEHYHNLKPFVIYFTIIPPLKVYGDPLPNSINTELVPSECTDEIRNNSAIITCKTPGFRKGDTKIDRYKIVRCKKIAHKETDANLLQINKNLFNDINGVEFRRNKETDKLTLCLYGSDTMAKADIIDYITPSETSVKYFYPYDVHITKISDVGKTNPSDSLFIDNVTITPIDIRRRRYRLTVSYGDTVMGMCGLDWVNYEAVCEFTLAGDIELYEYDAPFKYGTPLYLNAMNGVDASDITCMKVAQIFAQNSHCISHKVGAVIARDGRIISTGYNGTVSGQPNCDVVMKDKPREEHREWSERNEIHAEMNAILYAVKNGVSLAGCSLYTTLSPCHNCCKNIAQSGINHIYYLEEYDHAEEGWIERCREYGINVTKVYDVEL